MRDTSYFGKVQQETVGKSWGSVPLTRQKKVNRLGSHSQVILNTRLAHQWGDKIQNHGFLWGNASVSDPFTFEIISNRRLGRMVVHCGSVFVALHPLIEIFESSTYFCPATYGPSIGCVIFVAAHHYWRERLPDRNGSIRVCKGRSKIYPQLRLDQRKCWHCNFFSFEVHWKTLTKPPSYLICNADTCKWGHNLNGIWYWRPNSHNATPDSATAPQVLQLWHNLSEPRPWHIVSHRCASTATIFQPYDIYQWVSYGFPMVHIWWLS